MSITPLPEPVIKYFPYSSVRPYQGRFIKTIYDCVNARSHLVMEGANGLGKTIAVLLGVEGGRSSEGADFPGKQLESVAIVGVPYMEPTPKVNAQIQHYENQFPGHGHEYGYIIPALRKASQAAGLPIRTLDDRGAIIFLDYRFSTRYCRRYLPLWIRKNMRTVPDEDGAIAKELILFFGFGNA